MDQAKLMKKAHLKSLRFEFVAFLASMILYGVAAHFKVERLEMIAICFIIGIPILAAKKGNWSPNSQKGKFSWDFIYSLPLNKSQQAKLCADLNISSTILVFYMMCLCFGRSLMQEQTSLINLIILSFVAAICTFPITYIFAYYGLKIQLNQKRRMYQSSIKGIKRIEAIRVIGKILLGGTTVSLVSITCVMFFSFFKIPSFVEYSLIAIMATCFTYIFYIRTKKSTLEVFHNYKMSYIDPVFKPVKDGLTSVIIASLFIFVFFGLDDSPEKRYSDDRISQLVKNRSYEKLAELKASIDKINKTNSYGYNPYMLSIVLGDLKALKILEARGAKPSKSVESDYRDYKMNAFLLSIYKGHLNITKYLLEQSPELIKSVASMYKLNALHVSALDCNNNEIMDYLLTGYRHMLNSKTAYGETALHISAQKGCLTNIVSLSEAGAQRDIKTKDNKIAFDYIRKGNRGNEVRNYFKKLDRAPASIKSN